MGSKKNKVKKLLAPSPPPNTINAIDDEGLVEDLFAMLDSQEQTIQQQQQEQALAAGTTTDASDKTSSKSRFKARQVRLSRRDRFELVIKAYPQGKERSRAG